MFSAPQSGFGRTPHFQTETPFPQRSAKPEDWLFTDHAKARIRQRGVQKVALNALLEYGKVYHSFDGSDLVIFRKCDLNKISKTDRLAVEKQRSLYAVLSGDGSVITVGHRYRRIKRS